MRIELIFEKQSNINKFLEEIMLILQLCKL